MRAHRRRFPFVRVSVCAAIVWTNVLCWQSAMHLHSSHTAAAAVAASSTPLCSPFRTQYRQETVRCLLREQNVYHLSRFVFLIFLSCLSLIFFSCFAILRGIGANVCALWRLMVCECVFASFIILFCQHLIGLDGVQNKAAGRSLRFLCLRALMCMCVCVKVSECVFAHTYVFAYKRVCREYRRQGDSLLFLLFFSFMLAFEFAYVSSDSQKSRKINENWKWKQLCCSNLHRQLWTRSSDGVIKIFRWCSTQTHANTNTYTRNGSSLYCPTWHSFMVGLLEERHAQRPEYKIVTDGFGDPAFDFKTCMYSCTVLCYALTARARAPLNMYLFVLWSRVDRRHANKTCFIVSTQ